MAYRPLSIGAQIDSLGAPEDILAQSIQASQAGAARKKAALDLAKQTMDNKAQADAVQEDAKRKALLTTFIQNREGAQDIPIGVQAPEFVPGQRPSNAPFGPLNAPAPQPNPMERQTTLGLAAVNPDLAESFRKGQLGERQGAEDRTRKMAGEDQKQIQEGATFAETKQKDANTQALDTRKQDETERDNRVKNNIAYIVANATKEKADKSGQPKPVDPMKLAKQKNSTVAAINEIDATQAVLNRLQNHPGLNGLTGFGGSIPYDVPGGKTRDAEALRQQLTAKSAFAELQKMRASSPTGGALGQVSDKEEQMLSNAAAALQRGQSPQQFAQNLKLFNDLLENSKANLRDAYKTDYGEDLPDPTGYSVPPVNVGEWQ